MSGCLPTKIADDGLEGSPGWSKPSTKANRGSGDISISPAAAIAAIPKKKRKVASELVREDTPTKRVRLDLNGGLTRIG